MSTQTILGQSFPTPCKRCGGALYRQVDYCPYCGAAHPLETGPHTRIVTPGSRASAGGKETLNHAFEPMPRAGVEYVDHGAAHGHERSHEHGSGKHSGQTEPPLPASLAIASPDVPIPPLDHPPGRTGSGRPSIRLVLLAIAAVVAIALAYVGYALFAGNHDVQNSNADQAGDTEDAGKSTTGTIALYTPGRTNQGNQPAQAAPSIQSTQPAQPAVPQSPLVRTPQAITAPPPPIVVAKPATPQYRDADQALQAARTALKANDLSTAQAALGAVQTLQPGNGDAQSLQDDVKPLASRRDAALQAAQACAAQQQWVCVRQRAGEALTIDTGNQAAKALLASAIVATGWAPLATHGASGAHTP